MKVNLKVLDKLIIKDSNNNKKSYTASAFFYGSLIVNLKLILSGMVIGPVQLSAFTGSEYAMAMSALGAIYVLRRTSSPQSKGDESEPS